MQLRCEKVLTPDGWKTDQLVSIENGRIGSLRDASADCDLDLNPGMLVPGFIDVQVNGGGGVLFNQQADIASLQVMADAHLRFGTTAMMPTLITDNIDSMQRAADVVAQRLAQGPGAVIGIHFEGPCLSVPKKGVHSADYIRPPSDAELATYLRKDLGSVMVTLAPETVPVDIIRELTDNDIKVCLGHSNADTATTLAALEAGATGFTHLFNAMSAMQSREPSMVGCALASDAYCGLILDHHHVHPLCSQVAIKAKSAQRIMLVTDAMAHVGTDAESLPFFDTRITRDGDKLTTPDGTLAGSCLDMLGAVVNAHRDLGVALEDAIVMASATPASFLGLADQLGSIAPGQRADLLLLDETLNIQSRWLCGQPENAGE